MDEFSQLQEALGDRYRIERPIGAGGMAIVYLAADLKLNRQVALKVLRPELSATLGAERFLREIEIAAGLNHPHIVPVHDSGEADGLLYFVMPYIDGESLRNKLVRQTRLPVEEAVDITRTVASALEYAHRQGIVHRDIKPENILLCQGEAMVADFGIALAVRVAGGERLTQAGIPLGTPGYMSPEQVGGERSLDKRSDVYSLACVLYEMLAGRPTFTGANGEAVMEHHMTQPPVPLTTYRPNVPSSIARAVARALSKQPNQRFATPTEFIQALAVTNVRAALGDRSIAVLPFGNMSPNPENEYFSDGITDDVITQLSKIPDLRVTSRTSVMRYKSTDQSIREIGNQLGVATVLEGSVRQAGGRVRIVSQLIDAQTDVHLWAETYDRDLTDIFEIQSDVAQKIADALQTTLSPTVEAKIQRRPTENVDAYTSYLKGIYLWHKCMPETAQRAIEQFENAIELDPNFAAAYSGLANAYTFLGVQSGDSSRPPQDLFRLAEQAAEHALEIDPTMGDAHATLGGVRFFVWDWAAAAAAFQRASELAGCCDAPHVKYAHFLAAMGNHGEAIKRVLEALAHDPVSPAISGIVAWHFYMARQFERAIDQANNTLELDATFPMAHASLALSQLQLGRPKEAIDHFESAIRIIGRVPLYLGGLGCAYAAAGRTDDAQGIIHEMDVLSDVVYVSPHNAALVYAWLGQHDAAIDWLQQAFAKRSPSLAFIRVEPIWDPLRGDDRFNAVVESMKFPAGKRFGGAWKSCATEEEPSCPGQASIFKISS